MRRSVCVALGAALVTAGCGGGSPRVLSAAPTSYLLGIDQLVSPDFTVDTAPRPMAAGDVAAAGGLTASQLVAAGFDGAATEDFFRDAGSLELATLNGPVEVTDTVEKFTSATGSAGVYRAEVARLDARSRVTALSTGSLGDAAHAWERSAVLPGGTAVAEITVEWLLDNLLDIVVVRGRDGAIRPDDALLLAHRQTVEDLTLDQATRSPG